MIRPRVLHLVVALAGWLTGTAAAQQDLIVFLHREPTLPEEAALAEQPLTCLRAALVTQGLEVDLATLRAITGEAFAPLLSARQDVGEPLRERQPLDVLGRACGALGVSGEWHLGLTPEQILPLIAREIGAQRPVITSVAHGPGSGISWNLVLGVDAAGGHFMVADPRVPGGRSARSCHERWSGPVPGPTVWADSPLFTAAVSASSRLPPPPEQLRLALQAWVQQSGAGSLPLADHPDAVRFARADVAHPAVIVGPDAARALAAAVASVEALDDSWMLWQMRTLLPQLAERREAGAAFLRGLGDLPQGGRCLALAASLEATAQTARAAASLMWNTTFRGIQRAADLLNHLGAQPPLVVDLAAMPAHERQILREILARWGQPWEMAIRSTPWGPVLTVDSHEQRERVASLLRGLADQLEATDQAAEQLLRSLD